MGAAARAPPRGHTWLRHGCRGVARTQAFGPCAGSRVRPDSGSSSAAADRSVRTSPFYTGIFPLPQVSTFRRVLRAKNRTRQSSDNHQICNPSSPRRGGQRDSRRRSAPEPVARPRPAARPETEAGLACAGPAEARRRGGPGAVVGGLPARAPTPCGEALRPRGRRARLCARTWHPRLVRGWCGRAEHAAAHQVRREPGGKVGTGHALLQAPGPARKSPPRRGGGYAVRGRGAGLALLTVGRGRGGRRCARGARGGLGHVMGRRPATGPRAGDVAAPSGRRFRPAALVPGPPPRRSLSVGSGRGSPSPGPAIAAHFTASLSGRRPEPDSAVPGWVSGAWPAGRGGRGAGGH